MEVFVFLVRVRQTKNDQLTRYMSFVLPTNDQYKIFLSGMGEQNILVLFTASTSENLQLLS